MDGEFGRADGWPFTGKETKRKRGNQVLYSTATSVGVYGKKTPAERDEMFREVREKALRAKRRFK